MCDALLNLKKQIRREIRQKRDALPLSERLSKSAAIITRLLTIPDISMAKIFFIYLSFSSEVITHDAIRRFQSEGKVIAVPIIDMRRKSMHPVLLKSFDELEPGPMGILQPKSDDLNPIPPGAIDIIVAPGIAFSEEGLRLGYGGGFYDRFLMQHRKTVYALAFELQINLRIPFDPEHDVRVDYIVTEQRLIDCRKSTL